MSYEFCSKFQTLSSSKKFWKSVKMWQSYREFKGGNFFERQCRTTFLSSGRTTSVLQMGGKRPSVKDLFNNSDTNDEINAHISFTKMLLSRQTHWTVCLRLIGQFCDIVQQCIRVLNKCLANAKRPCDCRVLCLCLKSSLCSCAHSISDMTSFSCRDQGRDSVCQLNVNVKKFKKRG